MAWKYSSLPATYDEFLSIYMNWMNTIKVDTIQHLLYNLSKHGSNYFMSGHMNRDDGNFKKSSGNLYHSGKTQAQSSKE